MIRSVVVGLGIVGGEQEVRQTTTSLEVAWKGLLLPARSSSGGSAASNRAVAASRTRPAARSALPVEPRGQREDSQLPGCPPPNNESVARSGSTMRGRYEQLDAGVVTVEPVGPAAAALQVSEEGEVSPIRPEPLRWTDKPPATNEALATALALLCRRASARPGRPSGAMPLQTFQKHPWHRQRL